MGDVHIMPPGTTFVGGELTIPAFPRNTSKQIQLDNGFSGPINFTLYEVVIPSDTTVGFEIDDVPQRFEISTDSSTSVENLVTNVRLDCRNNNAIDGNVVLFAQRDLTKELSLGDSSWKTITDIGENVYTVTNVSVENANVAQEHAKQTLTTWLDQGNTISADHLQDVKSLIGNDYVTVDTATSGVRTWIRDNDGTTMTEEQLQHLSVIISPGVSVDQAAASLNDWLEEGNTVLAAHLNAAQTLTGNNTLTVDTATGALREWVDQNTVDTVQELQAAQGILGDETDMDQATDALEAWLDEGNTVLASHLEDAKTLTGDSTLTVDTATDALKALVIAEMDIDAVRLILAPILAMDQAVASANAWFDEGNTVLADHLDAAQALTGDEALTVDTATGELTAWLDRNTVDDQHLEFVQNLVQEYKVHVQTSGSSIDLGSNIYQFVSTVVCQDGHFEYTVDADPPVGSTSTSSPSIATTTHIVTGTMSVTPHQQFYVAIPSSDTVTFETTSFSDFAPLIASSQIATESRLYEVSEVSEHSATLTTVLPSQGGYESELDRFWTVGLKESFLKITPFTVEIELDQIEGFESGWVLADIEDVSVVKKDGKTWTVPISSIARFDESRFPEKSESFSVRFGMFLSSGGFVELENADVFGAQIVDQALEITFASDAHEVSSFRLYQTSTSGSTTLTLRDPIPAASINADDKIVFVAGVEEVERDFTVLSVTEDRTRVVISGESSIARTITRPSSCSSR